MRKPKEILQSICEKFIYYVKHVVRRFNRDDCFIMAGAISYYFLLAIIPIVLLAVSILGFVLGSSDQAIKVIINSVQNFAPKAVEMDIAQTLHSIISGKSFFGGIAVILFIWLAGIFFDVIEKSINRIWGEVKERGFFHRRLISYVLIISTGLFLLASLFLSSLETLISGFQIPVLGIKPFEFPLIFNLLFEAIPLFLIILVFSIIYFVIPNTKISFKTALIGGCFAGGMWEIAKKMFNWYILNVIHYSTIFGTIGAIIALLVWIFYTANILLIGAEIIAVMYEKRQMKFDTK